jgi:lysine 2,3-aminomutase
MPDPTLRTLPALAAAGLMDAERAAELAPVAERYAVAVTPAMAALMDAADPADPMARQFLPDLAELTLAPEELADPIGDAARSPLPGLIHRYPDRVLLKVTHACAVYCRFCFRREVVGPGGEPPLTGEALARVADYIAERPAIWEVILSGGDPLVLSSRRLADILAALEPIPHVKVIRLHTRVPAVDPAAVTEALVAALKSTSKILYVALHANHPRELTPAARAACARLIDAGIPMVSQTVLLKGVNDDPDVLGALMRGFVETRIKPYHLNFTDLAPGTGHFRVSLAEAQAIMRALRGRYSGLCQPTLILDIPGGHGKSPVGPNYLSPDLSEITDPWGGVHALTNSKP